ncbi:hypothetical protein RHMOL_Rhmol06G0026700 [Rhododendron molle]|uniref:Uncharacterized protein n=1 Tax=Rhododendron molle TaxID=49168 RepID=A0ACC0N846_RHOML|nr:hypothetical protein RHMOL_Rhmol06G0026700 [Rhododendron molle]
MVWKFRTTKPFSHPFLSSSSSTTLLFSASVLLVFISCITTTTTTTEAAISLPKNVTIPAVIVFGDSIVDQGNNNNIETLVKCNFPPYGKDFMGGKPTGRFSNGKTPADMIAEELGIKELIPAYLDPNLQDKDLPTGVSFASGATGFDPQTPVIVSVISLDEQMKMFKEYIGRLKGMVGEERTNFILTNSVYLVIAGSDDLANTYFTIGIRKLQYDVNSYTDLMELHALGAKRIGLFGAAPIGCLPSQRTLGGGILVRHCAENYNQAAQMFNAKVLVALRSLKSSLNDAKARLVYVDIYNPLLDLIQNHEKYGFAVADKGCCGTGNIEAEVTQRLSNPKEAASKSVGLQSHEDLAKKLQEEMERNRKSSSGFRSDGSSGRRMKEVACPTCTVHLQVQVPSSGSETIECGVCQHPFLSVISLDEQMKMFKEYIGRLKGMVGEERTNFILTNSVYLVIAGSDDLANTYFTIGIRKLQYDVNSYTNLMELHELGAKRIGLFGAAPIGCLPSQRTLGGGILVRHCAENYNQAAQMFNAKVLVALRSLKSSLIDAKARLVYVDIYNPLLDLIQNHEKYGIVICPCVNCFHLHYLTCRADRRVKLSNRS